MPTAIGPSELPVLQLLDVAGISCSLRYATYLPVLFFVFSCFSVCFDKAMSFRKSILSAEHKAGTCYDCDILLKRCI